MFDSKCTFSTLAADSQDTKSSSTTRWVAAGICGGAVVLVAVLVGAVLFRKCRRQKVTVFNFASGVSANVADMSWNPLYANRNARQVAPQPSSAHYSGALFKSQLAPANHDCVASTPGDKCGEQYVVPLTSTGLESSSASDVQRVGTMNNANLIYAIALPPFFEIDV